MKHSIRVRLILTLTSLILFTLFLYWFMNMTFLESYYELNKKEKLGTVYWEVNEAYNNLSEKSDVKEMDELSITLDRLGGNNNMNLYIFDLYYNPLLMWPDFKYPSNLSEEQYKEIYSRIESYSSYNAEIKKYSKNKELMKDAEKYCIYKVYDERLDSFYLELFGVLDNECFIYARTNYQIMKESVAISNRFLTYVGLLATILGMIIMFFISRSFTKPILKLSDIARKMSNLDFEAKYNVTRQDEIGILGNSINTLSGKLKDTISELKSVNNELLKDIQNKIQIDEMRKEFLSNVSHELKTPIALIQGYAEGLKENVNEDAENKDFYCEVIMDEATKMNKMVKKLMSLNQIEFGNNQIAFERFDIVSVMKSVLASSEILFQQKEASLLFDTYEKIYVWADEYMVEEVITNYVSNALNHVSGERKIEVKLEKRDQVVRVSVFNSGEKIPEDDIEKIWIKFYKVDKARTREYGGSGIGLSIVKAIMTSLNRDFGVINRENGVEFWFELDIQMD